MSAAESISLGPPTRWSHIPMNGPRSVPGGKCSGYATRIKDSSMGLSACATSRSLAGSATCKYARTSSWRLSCSEILSLRTSHSAISEPTAALLILKAIEAVRSFGASVKKVLVIVDRDEGAREVFEDTGYEFFSIFRIGELL